MLLLIKNIADSLLQCAQNEMSQLSMAVCPTNYTLSCIYAERNENNHPIATCKIYPFLIKNSVRICCCFLTHFFPLQWKAPDLAKMFSWQRMKSVVFASNPGRSSSASQSCLNLRRPSRFVVRLKWRSLESREFSRVVKQHSKLLKLRVLDHYESAYVHTML